MQQPRLNPPFHYSYDESRKSIKCLYICLLDHIPYEKSFSLELPCFRFNTRQYHPKLDENIWNSYDRPWVSIPSVLKAFFYPIEWLKSKHSTYTSCSIHFNFDFYFYFILFYNNNTGARGFLLFPEPFCLRFDHLIRSLTKTYEIHMNVHEFPYP